MRKPDDEDDEDRVARRRRVARDGEHLRVPMVLMDDVQREVAAGSKYYGFPSDARAVSA